jgi:MOSC domain-containing protein YiiM
MRLLSINIGMPASHVIDGKQMISGIFKWPASGSVKVGRLGAVGDGQANQPNHGGPDQALSVYSMDHYRFWSARFGRDNLSAGAFGENLTVDESMSETEVCIGDVLAIGTTVVQVTHPRIPCFRLSYRLSVPLFHQEQLESGRIGYLLRVLKEGQIAAGDAIVLLDRDKEPVSIALCIAATLSGEALPEVLRRLSGMSHLSQKWRGQVSARLAARGAPASV